MFAIHIIFREINRVSNSKGFIDFEEYEQLKY
jgi:hypothetical protein